MGLKRVPSRFGKSYSALFWMCAMDFRKLGHITIETVECFKAQGCVFPEELKKFVKQQQAGAKAPHKRRRNEQKNGL